MAAAAVDAPELEVHWLYDPDNSVCYQTPALGQTLFVQLSLPTLGGGHRLAMQNCGQITSVALEQGNGAPGCYTLRVATTWVPKSFRVRVVGLDSLHFNWLDPTKEQVKYL